MRRHSINARPSAFQADRGSISRRISGGRNLPCSRNSSPHPGFFAVANSLFGSSSSSVFSTAAARDQRTHYKTALVRERYAALPDVMPTPAVPHAGKPSPWSYRDGVAVSTASYSRPGEHASAVGTGEGRAPQCPGKGKQLGTAPSRGQFSEGCCSESCRCIVAHHCERAWSRSRDRIPHRRFLG